MSTFVSSSANIILANLQRYLGFRDDDRANTRFKTIRESNDIIRKANIQEYYQH